jgi:murein DD-endopeptidase MepM/ murein hydrolase activator NlpD
MPHILFRLALIAHGLSAIVAGALAPQPAPPQLWLPTPPGQPWRVIQGYGCGTHDDWDFYSLDLAATRGPSRSAPVYAAADGAVLAWVEPTGTLILDHGRGFYTMYTHMSQASDTRRGQPFKRGDQIGLVGDRGAPGTPHLHFTAYRAEGPWGRAPRHSLPLRFADGYDLPNIRGCDQHHDRELVAAPRKVPPAHGFFLPLMRRAA